MRAAGQVAGAVSQVAFALIYFGVFTWLLIACEWNPVAAMVLFLPAMVMLVIAAPALGFAVGALILAGALAVAATRGCGRIIGRRRA